MRRILLASASIVAFAGAAAAQDEENPTGIIFSGDASLGFNDATAGDAEGDQEDTGFFYEANLGVTFRTVLESGFVAESTFTIPIADTNLSTDLSVDSDFVLGLSVDGVGALQLGDVAFGGETFSFANMQSADFSEQDSETTLRGEGTIAGFTVAASALILDEDGDEPGDRGPGDADDVEDYVDQISIGANGAIGPIALSFGYQDESDILGGEDDPTTVDVEDSLSDVFDSSNGDFNPDEQYGLAAGVAFRGATVTLGYGSNLTDETESYGVQVAYPFGPVTATVEYVLEPDFDQDSYRVALAYSTDRLLVEAEFGEEIGEEEYDLKVGYSFSDVTSVQLGHNDDDGSFIALRQGLGAGAFVEASYAEVDDAGFGNDDFVDDIRLGATLKVGLEF